MFYLILFILFSLFILLIYQTLKIKNLKEDIRNYNLDGYDSSLPSHTHSPISKDNILLPQNLDLKIREKISKNIENNENNENNNKLSSVQELGFEYDKIDNKLIFNKPIEFNSNVIFNNQDINFNGNLLKINSDIISDLNLLGITKTNDILFYDNELSSTKSITDILNNEKYEDEVMHKMIAPFWVDFNNLYYIYNDMPEKNWYLCNGMSVNIEVKTSLTTTRVQRYDTPDLRGRFIWGGSNDDINEDYLIQNIDNYGTKIYNTDYKTFNETGGEEQVSLESENTPSHNHKTHGAPFSRPNENTSNKCGTSKCLLLSSERHGVPEDVENRNFYPHNNLPPYIVLAYFIYLSPNIEL